MWSGLFYPQLEFIIIIRRKNSNVTNEKAVDVCFTKNSSHQFSYQHNHKYKNSIFRNQRITILLDFMNCVVDFVKSLWKLLEIKKNRENDRIYNTRDIYAINQL